MALLGAVTLAMVLEMPGVAASYNYYEDFVSTTFMGSAFFDIYAITANTGVGNQYINTEAELIWVPGDEYGVWNDVRYNDWPSYPDDHWEDDGSDNNENNVARASGVLSDYSEFVELPLLNSQVDASGKEYRSKVGVCFFDPGGYDCEDSVNIIQVPSS